MDLRISGVVICGKPDAVNMSWSVQHH